MFIRIMIIINVILCRMTVIDEIAKLDVWEGVSRYIVCFSMSSVKYHQSFVFGALQKRI